MSAAGNWLTAVPPERTAFVSVPLYQAEAFTSGKQGFV